MTATKGRSAWRTMFIGPNGFRAGWRVAIFLVIAVALLAGVPRAISRIPGVGEWLRSLSAASATPIGQLLGLWTAISVLVAGAIMGRLEKRSFADYGLPWTQAFGRRFWQGVPLGFLMLCLLLGVISALGGFALNGFAVRGATALEDAGLFAIVFIGVGFFEEFSFRGYLQSTLASGMGFWPAAVLLSVLFGAAHSGNSGEALLGEMMAGGFGLVSAFALRRTGNIWLSIGMHASFDWGETCFFGVPDSGAVAQGHILNSLFHGPVWLTGGSVGPEASVFAFGVLIVWALIIHVAFPAPAAHHERGARGELVDQVG
jgi:uncharacterized protein